ncbi:PEP/pyruvate-binding domain-containing protein [Vallitalea okinawensis]|uniref:PEP/pyruvate-binding domain-containing protein n=1 Tax=Vallitalea okinawensis TaxID=2078660 RepID=UPI000CFB4F1D|nr:PEP/pyruvate-binding domain-containing protein [Vallitalea okinawensis]
MIKWFSDIKETDFELVGGKGHNLSKMYNCGLKVPNGFVITSKAYDVYIKDNDLTPIIEGILKQHISSLEKSNRIKALFIKENVSKKLVGEIKEAFIHISSGRVAVRSSSTVEDLPGMSFAGQYSSYLNVTQDDLIEKVIRCWQSLWNQRAIDYRKKYDVTTEFSHGVVVQEMIEAKVAGVIFTANPVSGVRSQILVNAAYGLGESIVSGEVNPDQYTLDHHSGTVLKEEISKKEVLCQYAKEGIEYVAVEPQEQERGSLKPNHIKEIVKEAGKVQNFFGCPQDMEFAIDQKNNLYILQSRGITTLFPIDSFDQDGKLRAYLAASSVLLGMKEAFTPLGADLYGGMFPMVLNVMLKRKKPISDNFVKYAGGRIYVDITYLMASRLVAKQFGNAFSGSDLPLKDTMDHVIKMHGKTFRHQGIRFKIPWGIFKYGFGMMENYKIARKVAPDDRYQAIRNLGKEFYQDILNEAEQLNTVEEKIKFCEDSMLKVFKLTQNQALYCVEVNNYSKIEKSLKKIFGDQYNLDILTYALPECITVELGLELNKMAKYFDEKGLEPTADDPMMKAFLKKFGHRSTVELDFGYKRWHEDPKYLFNQMRSYMVDKMYDRNIAEVKEKAKEARDFIEQIFEEVKVKKGIRKAKKLRDMIIDYRRAAGMREYPKFNIVQSLDLSRKVMLGVGKSYQQQGLLDDPEDIFFLTKKDILSGKLSKETVRKNRELYNKEMTRNSVPRIVLNTGETHYSAHKFDPKSKVLQGISLSAGVYEGRVRVVFDPNSSELQEGEILVTESTNPAWTPLFMAAKGLIMEYGGPLSHGGIVAREYGIPAVVGIPSVKDLLMDGQLVRVNGETGTVEILDE